MGIFLPLLPTTPFLLLSSILWFRGSPRLYKWLLNHKRLGPYIRNFMENKAIPLRVKVISVSLVWLTLLYCSFFMAGNIWLATLFIVLAIGITWHILSYKTLSKTHSFYRSSIFYCYLYSSQLLICISSILKLQNA